MAEILTHTDAISQENFEDYSKSYSQIGNLFTDLPLINNLPETIAKLLPTNYNAVNLGSGIGQQTEKITEFCKSLGKNGTFINVDPFINQHNVIKTSSQDFIISQKAAYRCLKDTGKIVIIQMGNQCRLPWTEALQENYLMLLLLADDFIPKDLFKWNLIKDKVEKSFDKATFRKLIQERGLSNLLVHTSEEIEECLAKIDSQQRLQNATICFWQFIIEKI